MTNQDILRIAMEQSAADLNCRADDFLKSENVVVESASLPQARKYLQLPFFCQLVTYGNNVVASGAKEFMPEMEKYISRFSWYRCFETPQMHVLERMLTPYNHKVCFMAEYFLPDMNALRELNCPYPVRVLEKGEFDHLYLPEWSNALCFDRKHLDVLAVGAYDGDTLIGLAGVSADCDSMWQIGIDVLPAYRRQGIASALTSRMALEVLKRGKVPFYCAAWSNIRSVRNAVKAGFKPAWVEMTAKPCKMIDEMNGGN